MDNQNLLINSTYFFDLLEATNNVVLGKVTIHCHVTTKVVQLQGSRLISGLKAPVWFYNNVIKNTFDKAGAEKEDTISKVNKDLTDLTSNNCTLCDSLKS